MRVCKYCSEVITNYNKHGWVGEDGHRRCYANNEVMLKEHIPGPDSTWLELPPKFTRKDVDILKVMPPRDRGWLITESSNRMKRFLFGEA